MPKNLSPDDIWEKSFSFLGPDSIPVLALVCKQWKNLLAANNSYVATLMICNLAQTCPDAVARVAHAAPVHIDWRLVLRAQNNYQQAKQRIELSAPQKALDEADLQNNDGLSCMLRKDTCGAAMAGGSLFSSASLLVSCFICKEAACIVSLLFCLAGSSIGGAWKTNRIRNELKLFKEQQTRIAQSLPLLERAKRAHTKLS